MDHLLGEVILDKKKRLALGKILKKKKISSFEIYETEKGYLLRPKVSIPLDEVWIFENKKVAESLSKGLSQKATHNLASFSKYAEDE